MPEATDSEGGQANAAEDRLFEILEGNGIDNTILEAAEVASAIGGVYLRPTWDRDVSDDPILTIVHQDYAVPSFASATRGGDVLGRAGVDEKDVRRHLERHELSAPATIVARYILHGLYKGSQDALGTKEPLTELEQTAGSCSSSMPTWATACSCQTRSGASSPATCRTRCRTDATGSARSGAVTSRASRACSTRSMNMVELGSGHSTR